MCEATISNLAFTILFAYFFMIPLFYNLSWNDSGTSHSFIKWYFIKSDRVNILGYLLVLIIGSGSFIWALIGVPIIWLFEFIFLNKDCSNLRSEELMEKEWRRRQEQYMKKFQPDLRDVTKDVFEVKEAVRKEVE